MLERIPVCEECGVPRLVGWELDWEDNGIINSKSSPGSRWVFFESGSFDPIFEHIEELIGMPIRDIVMESRRNEARKYMARLFPPDIRKAFASWDARADMTAEQSDAVFRKTMDASIAVYDVARIYGYAAIDPGELWEARADFPWRTNCSRNLYSIPLYLAEGLGSCEAFEDRDMWVDHTLSGEDYHVRYYPTEHPLELKGITKRARYDFKGGAIAYERCPGCDVPVEISRYVWDLENGSITNPDTGRRMAIFGTRALDAVLFALADELGDEIDKTIIEAQRIFTKTDWSNENWKRQGADFQRIIALRGMGDLTVFEGDRKQLNLRIRNSCLHPLIIGNIQALVELAYNVDKSTASWEACEDGDLDLTVRV